MMSFGGMWLGWALWLSLIAIAIWLAFTLAAARRTTPDRRRDSALEILRERFALGEISREEYEQLRRTLLSA